MIATQETTTLTVPAPAKINLYFNIIGRRSDGYHIVDSLIAFTRLGDTLTVRAGNPLDIVGEGPFSADLPPAPQNLVYRAAETLAAVPFPTDHLSRVMVENLADHLNKMSKHDFVELVRQTLALATQSFAVADPYAAIIATVVMENFFMAVLENKKHINTITKLTAFDAYFKARDAHLRTFA